MIGSMAPVLARDGPIVPRLLVLTGVQELTALEAVVKAVRLFVPVATVVTTQEVLPRTVVLDLALGVCQDQALVLLAAIAHDPGVAIAAAPGVAIATAQGVAIAAALCVSAGLIEATVHALKRPVGDLLTGAGAPDRMVVGRFPAHLRCRAVHAISLLNQQEGLDSKMKVTLRCWFLIQTQRVLFPDFQPRLYNPVHMIILFTVYNRICEI